MMLFLSVKPPATPSFARFAVATLDSRMLALCRRSSLVLTFPVHGLGIHKGIPHHEGDGISLVVVKH